MPPLPALDGAFPEAEYRHAEASGLTTAAWPLALSLAPLPLAEAATPNLTGHAGQALPRADAGAPDTPLVIVCASRVAPDKLSDETPIGRSVARLRALGVPVQLYAACANGAALAKTYNAVLKPEFARHIAVFVHDDVWLDDYHLDHRLHEALSRFDVVGVAGNRNRAANQPAWAFPAQIGNWDDPGNLLGSVAHDISGKGDDGKRDFVGHYGSPHGTARLLDGVFLAARVSTLMAGNTGFDERFPFHFYDLDFCRRAEAQGLRLGVWPIAITHHSGGNYRGKDWLACLGRYIGKWGR